MKQAVVLIHGIGEQRPMDTLRGFASAILDPPKKRQKQFWSKPDPMTELFELRRLQVPGRTKTHLYEYYWAYHIEGTKWSHLLKWFTRLVFRRPGDVPPQLKVLWWATWVGMAALLALFAGGGFSAISGWYATLPRYGITALVLGLLLSLLNGFSIYYVGDAARYLSPHPQNINLRQKIRKEGVQLLRNLHKCNDYDRIIVVGHSLGSVIGYDIITRYWDEVNTQYDFKSHAQKLIQLLAAKEKPQPMIRKGIFEAGKDLHQDQGKSPMKLEKFRDAQREGWKEQRQWGNPWRITDFVTLGSPLAHAILLMARSKKEFWQRVGQREFPTCPPLLDAKGYAYPSTKNVYLWNGMQFTPVVLHHAAPFAVTRWTNLYFPARFGLFGDTIGGPLRPYFGCGVKDVPVSLDTWRRFTPAAHTAYWKPRASNPDKAQAKGSPPHTLEALKEALGLNSAHVFKIP